VQKTAASQQVNAPSWGCRIAATFLTSRRTAKTVDKPVDKRGKASGYARDRAPNGLFCMPFRAPRHVEDFRLAI
jgi:hypothetical protein